MSNFDLISKVIVDAASLRNCGIQLAHEFHLPDCARFNNVSIDCAVNDCILNFEKDTEKLVVLTANFGNDSYKSYSESWEKLGYKPIQIDYRHVANPGKYVSGVSPIGEEVSSLSPIISYMMGAIVHDAITIEPIPQIKKIIIVSHSFDLHVPVMDMLNRGFEVCLVYFKQYIDHRWFLLEHDNFKIVGICNHISDATNIYPTKIEQYDLI